jgi:hypothetical protein
MAFRYLLKIKVGTPGLTLQASLQDKEGDAILFADSDEVKTDGFIEQGEGDYSFWSDKWPLEALPFTVLIEDGDDNLVETVDINREDLWAV